MTHALIYDMEMFENMILYYYIVDYIHIFITTYIKYYILLRQIITIIIT